MHENKKCEREREIGKELSYDLPMLRCIVLLTSGMDSRKVD